jgi:hypothetical protein
MIGSLRVRIFLIRFAALAVCESESQERFSALVCALDCIGFGLLTVKGNRTRHQYRGCFSKEPTRIVV